MPDDVHLGHSLGPGGCRDVALETGVTIVDSLDSCPLAGVPPRHSNGHRGRDGVTVHWVVDHSGL